MQLVDNGYQFLFYYFYFVGMVYSFDVSFIGDMLEVKEQWSRKVESFGKYCVIIWWKMIIYGKICVECLFDFFVFYVYVIVVDVMKIFCEILLVSDVKF